jgi:acetyl esterase/lipase
MRIEDVTYHPGAGAPPLPARLYIPEGAGPFPGVVSVHGGAWTFGDRTMNASLDGALAEAGLLVMAPEMRKPPVARYPGSVQDVNLAVRWLKSEGPRFGMRAGVVALLGTSSGGHQAMLAALRPHHPDYAALPGPPGVDAAVSRVATCWGVLDPLARYRMAIEQDLAKMIEAHHAWWPDAAAMEDASPWHIVARGEAARLPPALLIQGTADGNLTPDMAESFATAYRAAGGDAALRLYPGRGHLFATQDPEAADSRDAVAAVAAFLLATEPLPRM